MLEDLYAFRQVVEQKSFTKAANRLGLSIAVVTRRVARLEKKLNLRLLYRTTREVNLTEAGKIYYDEVRELLDRLETCETKVKQFQHEVIGTLKIGIPPGLSRLFLVQNLKEFSYQYPKLNFQIRLGNYSFDLLHLGLDIAVHCGNLPDSSFYYQKLGDWSKIICAAPDYIKLNGQPVNLNELMHHVCLDHDDNLSRTWLFCMNGKIKELYINAKIRVNNSLDLKELALSGAGIAYLPSFLISEELQNKQLVAILKDIQAPKYPAYLLYPEKSNMSKKVKLGLEFLTKILKSAWIIQD